MPGDLRHVPPLLPVADVLLPVGAVLRPAGHHEFELLRLRRGGSFGLGAGGAEGLVEVRNAGEIGVRVELVGDVEGGADFDIFLREVVGVDEDFADLVGIC